MRVMTRDIRTIGVLAGLLLLIPACKNVGSATGAKQTTELAFKGRCVDTKGQNVPTFSLSVGRAGEPQPSAKTVKTTNGQFQARLAVGMPAAAGGKVLGSHNEKVTIKVSAQGYKSKNFTVTADQVLVGKTNTLNVTLEPSPS